MPIDSPDQKIGIIAGGGQFPLLLCRAAKDRGVCVVVTALEENADPALSGLADELVWIRMGQLGRLISTFKRNGVEKAILAGTVTKPSIFSGRWRPDRKFLSILPKVKNLHDDHLLRFLAGVLAEEGIQVQDSTLLLPELKTPPGRLTRRRLTKRERVDASYGFKLAKELGRLDIGQCIVVRSRAVVAVEAMEGTDETIRRGGALGRGRGVVIKVAKPHQDLRFDLPSAGPTTIRTMAQSGCSALILEAGQTLTFDREEMVDLADEAGIAIAAFTEAGLEEGL